MANRLQELGTKSALISEILRAAALRYSYGDLHASEATPTPSSSSCQEYPFRSVSTASTLKCHSEPSILSSNSGICFHTSGIGTAISEQCLLCLVKGNIHSNPGLIHHRCQNDSRVSTQSNPAVKWAKPSRPNAGICRAQVVSDYSTWCLSVEMCSNQQSSLDDKNGLQLATSARHGVSRVWRLSLDPATPPRKSKRTDFAGALACIHNWDLFINFFEFILSC